MKSIYLYPAQLAVSQEPAEIRTILGSCVAVALHDCLNHWGGLNHYLLAEPADATELALRYGSMAIPELVRSLEELGSRRQSLKAKIYGGAAVLANVSAGIAVGERNIQLARAMLRQLSIPIVEEIVGGNRGHKLTLITNTFEVRHEYMSGGNEPPDVSGAELPTIAKKVKILIVDDSMTVRQIFMKVLAGNPRITVVGVAADAYQARELLIKEKPDVVLLDIEMPRMNGVQFLEKIMTYAPTPTIMVSSLGASEEAAHRCMELGAVEFVHKPSQFDPVVLRTLAENLVSKSLAAASVPLRRQIARPVTATGTTTATSSNAASQQANEPQKARQHSSPDYSFRSQIVVLGGNMGAQQGLTELLEALAPDCPPVIAAVSSITAFLQTFLEKLRPRCRVELKIATDGAIAAPGQVYFAPAEHHVSLSKIEGGPFRIEVRKGLPRNAQLPSADVLFESLILPKRSLAGVVGILLSGFGADGTAPLLKLREAGAYTLVVDPKGVPFGFVPGTAIRIGAADEVLSARDMATAILKVRNRAVLTGERAS